ERYHGGGFAAAPGTRGARGGLQRGRGARRRAPLRRHAGGVQRGARDGGRGRTRRPRAHPHVGEGPRQDAARDDHQRPAEGAGGAGGVRGHAHGQGAHAGRAARLPPSRRGADGDPPRGAGRHRGAPPQVRAAHVRALGRRLGRGGRAGRVRAQCGRTGGARARGGRLGDGRRRLPRGRVRRGGGDGGGDEVRGERDRVRPVRAGGGAPRAVGGAAGARRPGRAPRGAGGHRDAEDRGGASALRRRPVGGGDPHRGVRGDGDDGARHLLHQGVLHGAGGDREDRPPRPREPPPARLPPGRRPRSGRRHPHLPRGHGEGGGEADECGLLADDGAGGGAGICAARAGAGGGGPDRRGGRARREGGEAPLPARTCV
ncbi:MAG: tRNA-modifying protein YgfZ, partial [uncultured Gemmatimonadetes bacterium]